MVATGTSVRPRKSKSRQVHRVSHGKEEKQLKKTQEAELIKDALFRRPAPAIRRELIPLKHGDAEDVLVQVFDEELAAEVPFRVYRVILRP